MVTAIIVNYNAGALLTECVRSVLASSVPIRVVVSDNGSVDGSIELLRDQLGGSDSLTIIENKANLGFARANNIALPHVEGEYLLLLNPDCIIRPDTLEKMVGFMDEHPDAGMSGCLIRNLDGSEQAGCRRNIPTPWRSLIRVSKLNKLIRNHPRFQDFNLHGTPLPEQPILIESISGAFMLVRSNALKVVGELDENYFLHCEDIDWCMRFRQAKYNIYFVPSVEISHLKGGSGSVSPSFVEWHKHKGMIRFYRKFFRHQYPGILMVAVFVLVWIRLIAKISYVTAKNYLNRSRGAVTLLGQLRGAGLASIATAQFGSSQFKREPHLSQMQSHETAHADKDSPHLAKARDNPNIIVTGATSMIGHFLLPRLMNASYEVHAISRKVHAEGKDALALRTIWHVADITHPEQLPLINAVALIHLGPLWLLPPLLPLLSELKVRRVIGFGSTSLFSKVNSADEGERNFVARLAAAESEISRYCAAAGMHWTVFRPTLIYDCTHDKNITVIARFIKRYGFFPLAGKASGLRQPVHADDLAAACVTCLDSPDTFNKAYNLSGGETLNYRNMVAKIFEALGKKPRFVPIPLHLYQAAIRMATLLPSKRNLTGEMATRMNVDLCFDHSDAEHDFAFKPRSLTLAFKNGL